MSERVTPRTAWAAMKEAYPPEVLVRCAKLGAATGFFAGGAYLIILCVLFFSTGAWHFDHAVLGMVFWAAGMAVICGIVKLVEWIRWR